MKKFRNRGKAGAQNQKYKILQIARCIRLGDMKLSILFTCKKSNLQCFSLIAKPELEEWRRVKTNRDFLRQSLRFLQPVSYGQMTKNKDSKVTDLMIGQGKNMVSQTEINKSGILTA